MSELTKCAWGWEYTSDNGILYEIGEVTSEFNVIKDPFMDILEMFDCNILEQAHFVDYVFGDIDDETEHMKEWIDERIARYENHERTIRFYRNIIGREDTLYECYLGLAEEKHEQAVRISRERLAEMAEEDIS